MDVKAQPAVAMLTYAQAAATALATAMDADPRIVALGEDLGRGGVFGQYTLDGQPLAARFGPERIIDTPISEANIMGAAVGMALAGLKPVVEMRVIDFALCGMDELVNQAAKNRYMFGGQGRVPLVARMPIGIWTASAAQHSQSLEAWFAHLPGVVVVCPGTPQDNHGLLASALACGDPVVYLEHKELWGLRGEVDRGLDVPLGRARIARAGRDLTLVTWSRTLQESLQADLRTLWPWDRETVLASVARTGRLLVVHEAVQVAGFGAEVAATVAEALGCPVKRLGSPRIPVGYAPTLEAEARVDASRIARAARTWLAR
jgi:acetoin:2,6-dichlorophenolindophenol oxidoreductase subunit beta